MRSNISRKGRSIWMPAVLGLAVGAQSVLAATTIVYVNPLASGANDGTSWEDAFNNSSTALQDALDDAATHVGPSDDVQIWVAKATYKPSLRTNPADARTVTFKMIDKVALYGGFVDVCVFDPPLVFCDDLGDRAFACSGGDYAGKPCAVNGDCPGGFCLSAVTTLSGDIGTIGVSSDNAFHVLTYDSPDAAVTIDGFIVEDGNANGSGLDNQGSGLQIRRGAPKYCYGGTNDGGTCIDDDDCPGLGGGDPGCSVELCLSGGPAVANCLFRNNAASNHAAANDHGSDSTFDNCVFRDNTAVDGAGLLVDSGDAAITDCLFIDNTSSADGGGLWTGCRSPYAQCAAVACAPTVTDTTFTGNSATQGGGAFNGESSPTFTDCDFLQNSTTGANGTGGAGMWNDPDTTTTLTDCLFEQNSTAGNQFGGAIYDQGATVVASGCEFRSNSSAFGGAAYDKNATATFTDTLFIGNAGTGLGAAFYVEGTSTLDFSRCEFFGNGPAVAAFISGTTDGNWVNTLFSGNLSAAVLFNGVPTVTITNCTIVANPGGGLTHISSGGTVDVANSNLWCNNTRVISFTADITAACAGTGSGASGSGTFTLDTCTGLLTYNITISGLEGTETGAHMHYLVTDPCLTPGGGPIRVNLPLGSPKTGSLTLTRQDQDELLAGDWHVNILTTAYPGGEITGAIDPTGAVPDLEDSQIGFTAGLTVTYSNWQGHSGGTGNIDINPAFVDVDGADNIIGTEDDDDRLAAGSPCIDAADNDAIAGHSSDLDVNTRRVEDISTADTGVPSDDCPYVDMGAYEFQVASWCCVSNDFNCSPSEVCCAGTCFSGTCCDDTDCTLPRKPYCCLFTHTCSRFECQ